ncbi:MAG: DUF5723 family protein [Chitinophagaceae bacterium]
MNTKIFFAAFSIIVSMHFTSKAQSNLTLYHMNSVQQNNYQNPAKKPKNKFNLSLPIISSIGVNYQNNGFAYADLIAKRADDSLVLTTDNMLSKLKPNNTFLNNINTDIIAFGFKVKRSYISFNASLKTDVAISYTKDMMTFALKGNTAFLGKTVNLNFDLNTSAYLEYGLGFAHTTKNNQFSYGARLKLLSGIANTQSEKIDISLYTNETDYAIKATSNIIFNSSSVDTGENDIDYAKYIFGKNRGAALDFGIEYKPIDDLVLSASIVDIGAITWREKVSNYKNKKPNASFEFSGFNLQNFFDNANDFEKSIDSLSDSLTNTFDLVKTTNEYKTTLPTKIYVGASYQLTSFLSVNALFAGRFINKKMQNNVCLSLNADVTRWLHFTGSYSMANGVGNNVGFGMSINAGFLQLYAVTDNVSAILHPEKAKYANVQAGLNLCFGRPKKPKKHADDTKPDTSGTLQ